MRRSDEDVKAKRLMMSSIEEEKKDVEASSKQHAETLKTKQGDAGLADAWGFFFSTTNSLFSLPRNL